MMKSQKKTLQELHKSEVDHSSQRKKTSKNNRSENEMTPAAVDEDQKDVDESRRHR